MERCYRIIAFTPFCGEEFTGYFAYSDKDPEGEERLRVFADLLVAENAEDYVQKHLTDLTDEEAWQRYYEGCSARFEEIDYDTFMEEAFEDYELEGEWV